MGPATVGVAGVADPGAAFATPVPPRNPTAAAPMPPQRIDLRDNRDATIVENSGLSDGLELTASGSRCMGVSSLVMARPHGAGCPSVRM
jgi:hypothetical protein